VSKALIFSDIHLKVAASDRERHREFAAFLRSFDPAEYPRIICLGDLFDFWFEYRSVIFSDYFEVLRAFADLRDAGAELHLICGNHDFWGGRFLEEFLGMEIHPGAVDMEIGGHRVHFVHGDGIDPKDHSYRIYKRIARNPFVVWAFRQLHPDWAMGLARAVSHSSRTLRAPDNPHEGPQAQALRRFGERKLSSGEADVVMTGHAHAPLKEEVQTPGGTGLYFNAGDWLYNRTYIEWTGKSFELKDWSAPT
jgi:UDP-2,3-diacylglucosamine hydrolase